MRSRLVLLALLVGALLSVLFLREQGPDAAARPPGRPREPRAQPPLPAGSAPVLPGRNPFEYAETGTRRPLPATAAPVTSPSADAPETKPDAIPASPEPVRLVGLVHRGGKLQAALSILGEVMILGPDEEAEGYRVLSIDEEAGVRLRDPDGTELTLALRETS